MIFKQTVSCTGACGKTLVNKTKTLDVE